MIGVEGMYYTVGETNKGVYIWDTQDSSCQYIDKEVMKNSGVVAPVMRFNYGMSIYKFLTLFNMEKCNDALWQKELVRYELENDIIITLSVLVYDKGVVKLGLDNLQNSDKYGYIRNYVVLLYLDINASESRYSPDIDINYINYVYILDKYNYFWKASGLACIELPPCIMGYLLRLCGSKDFDGLHLALGNLIFEKVRYRELLSSDQNKRIIIRDVVEVEWL